MFMFMRVKFNLHWHCYNVTMLYKLAWTRARTGHNFPEAHWTRVACAGAVMTAAREAATLS